MTVEVDSQWDYDPQAYLRQALAPLSTDELTTLRIYAARTQRESGLWYLRVWEDFGLDRYYDGNFLVRTSLGEHGPFSYDGCRTFLAGMKVGVAAAAEETSTSGDYSFVHKPKAPKP